MHETKPGRGKIAFTKRPLMDPEANGNSLVIRLNQYLQGFQEHPWAKETDRALRYFLGEKLFLRFTNVIETAF
jgi:hypothetical protein